MYNSPKWEGGKEAYWGTERVLENYRWDSCTVRIVCSLHNKVRHPCPIWKIVSSPTSCQSSAFDILPLMWPIAICYWKPLWHSQVNGIIPFSGKIIHHSFLIPKGTDFKPLSVHFCCCMSPRVCECPCLKPVVLTRLEGRNSCICFAHIASSLPNRHIIDSL